MVKSINLHPESETERSQIRRAENVQVLVAIAAVSAILTIYTSKTPLGDLNPIFLAIPFMTSLFFLISKLASLTLRPYTSWKYLDFFDQSILPILFVTAFGGSSTVLIVIILNQFISTYGGVIRLETLVSALTSPPNLIVLVATVVSIGGGVWYARRTAQTMSELQTAVTNSINIATSGISDDHFEIRLNNSSEDDIPPEDVEIEIESATGVDIEVSHATETRSDVYQLLRPIPANSPVNFSIGITRSDLSNSISERSFDLVVRYQGEERGRHHVTFSG